MVKLFWKEDFEKYPAQFKKEVASPIQNKIGQLLTNNYIRNIVGQSHSTIDLKFMMDNRRVLLVNLAKGRVGEDKANLLGSMLVTKLYLAALERQNMPEDERKDFYLYIDEFQNFSTDVFPSITTTQTTTLRRWKSPRILDKMSPNRGIQSHSNQTGVSFRKIFARCAQRIVRFGGGKTKKTVFEKEVRAEDF